VLTCLIFIIDMGRPLVGRRRRGDSTSSLRVRTERDAEILRASGRRRVILDLQGVMFFGNTDDLCTEIDSLFAEADMILLNFQRVADIDAFAVVALEQATAKAHANGRLLLFCSVPEAHADIFAAASGAGRGREALVFADLDSALEWMEERVLHEAGHSEFEELPLDRIEMLHGLDMDEIATVRNYLVPLSVPAGATLCREGDKGDHLWLLCSGSVSIWLGSSAKSARRVAALARGTVVGEMSVLESGTRSASVLADEKITGYTIDRQAFESLLHEHPRIGGRVLANIARELARRLRRTSLAIGAESG
jgi:CRP-like cAMP-binding protein/anti-anti-sigma regulatory factor